MEKYIFSELVKDEQSEIKEYFLILSLLLEFQNKVNLKLFEFLFKENADYLWKLFVVKCNRQILEFLNKTDVEIKSTIVTNIYMFSKDIRTDSNMLYSNC